MTRDQIINERASIVAALEMPGLSQKQRDRGWKRFDELQALLQVDYREDAKEHIQNIRDTLRIDK